MNNQIISQIRNLLSPAALAYLNALVSGSQPLETRPGISATPEGLTAAQARVVRSIVQAEDETDLNASSIINSGILRTRGGLASDNIPQSSQELYDRLYNITTGESLGALGPQGDYSDYGGAAGVAGVSAGPMRTGSAAMSQQQDTSGGIVRPGRAEPTATPEDPLGRPTGVGGFGQGEDRRPLSSLFTGDSERDIRIRAIARHLSPGAQEYLRRVGISGRYDRLALPQGVTADGRSVLDRLLAGEDIDPSDLNIGGVVAPGRETGQALREAFGSVDSIIADRDAPRPYYDPVVSGIVYLNPTEAEQRGLTGTELDPVAVERQFGTGAGDIEPGELSRPGMGGAPGVITADEQILRDLLVPGASGQANQETLEQFYGDTATTAATTTPGVEVDTSGAPSTAGDPTAFDQAIPQDWRDAAMEAYPEYYAIIRNIPEIAELLEKAINQGYSPQQFQAQLEQTNWWQQTTASAREWDINGERDPATQQTLIDNQITFIRDTALNQFGVRLGPESLEQLATDSLRFGWSPLFLRNAIGDVATQSTAGISQLRAGYVGQQLRQTANNYGIAVSDATFNSWVNKIAVGEETQDTWQAYALTQAKNLFPSISDRLDAGETFQDVVEPYRQTAARVLELGTGEDIDFTDPEWAKAVTFMDNEGNQRPMSYNEWNDYLRQTRSFGYEYTTEARARAYGVARDLANLFGRA